MVKTEGVDGEATVAKMQALCSEGDRSAEVCCTCRYVTISSFIYGALGERAS